MKSTMKLIIVALAVFLVVGAAPVAARVTNILDIRNGDHIYVYEKGVNLATNLGAVTALRKFVDDDPCAALIKEIPVGNANAFDVTSDLVGGVYGIYYPVNTVTQVCAGTGQPTKADSTLSVYITATDLKLGVYNPNRLDSVDGKSITRDDRITFKVSAPDFGANYKWGAAAPFTFPGRVDVRIITPNGGEIFAFGNPSENLGSFPVAGSENWTPNITLTGIAAGTYTATLKFSSGQNFTKQAGTDSNSVTFTVLSKPITLTTNKESVVRGNNFVVTITAKSLYNYYLYIKSASVSAGKTFPLILDNQVSVNSSAAALAEINANLNFTNQLSKIAGAPVLGTAAIVQTTAGGTRSIEINTTSTTDDKKYTIKAVDPADPSKYDQVDVTVEKGQVTITYEGTGSYYLGETVKLTGTNTDSKKVYLFIKGPNLGDSGRSLADISVITTDPCAAGGETCWKVVDVNTDNTWSYKWDTSALSQQMTLDAGTYTIYAVAVNASGVTLSDKTYATASIVLKKPFVTASASTNTLARGDILYIRGTAEGKPTNVYVWVFGKNYRDLFKSASVRSDASYEHKMDRGTTEGLYAGQYFAVVQHPMMNGFADVVSNISPGSLIADSATVIVGTWTTGNPTVKLAGLQASDAATALVDLLNSPNVDDTYTKLSFMIEEPWLRIDTVGDKFVGDTFKITGTTNLAEGDQILMTVVSSSFQPTEKTQAGEFSGASGTVSVQKGDTYNTFSFDVDASTFKPDEYLVKAESVQPSQSTTTTFNVLEGQPTTAVTTAPPTAATTVATPVQTTVATTVATPTAAAQPGFGALVALVGLGAVALLVLRRR